MAQVRQLSDAETANSTFPGNYAPVVAAFVDVIAKPPINNIDPKIVDRLTRACVYISPMHPRQYPVKIAEQSRLGDVAQHLRVSVEMEGADTLLAAFVGKLGEYATALETCDPDALEEVLRPQAQPESEG